MILNPQLQASTSAGSQPKDSPSGNHPPVVPDALMDTKSAAAFMGLAPLTLVDWRTKRVGPNWIKVGAACRYRRRDLEAWLDSRTMQGE